MTIIYDKPHKTIDEQIQIISNRNVNITNSPFVIEVLQSISYYTLMNGYKSSFLADSEGEKFKDGTTFNMIYTLHWIDISLSNLLFKYILVVEKSLKTKLSHLVGEKFGVSQSDYLFFRSYSNPNGSRNGILTDIRGVINNSKENTSTYYYKKNKNHVPPWIVVNDMTFGLTQKWYSILKGSDKERISEQFLSKYNYLSIDQKKEIFRKSLEILRAFRNKAAHGNRIFNLNIREKLPKTQVLLITKDMLSENEFDSGIGESDLNAILLILIILINDPIILENLLFELNTFFNPYIKNNTKFIDKSVFSLFNLPQDFLEKIEVLIDRKQ